MSYLKLAAFGLIMLAAHSAHAADEISLSAAASLKVPMLQIIKQFEAENPSVKVRSNFAGSSQLATQIEQGARVSVFASADRKNIDNLTQKGLIETSDVLAHNRLTVIFNTQNAKQGTSLESLAKPGLRLVAPSPKIPAGIYLSEFLNKADAQGLLGGAYSTAVMKNVVSAEPDIRMVAVKVAMGEGDAGVVYTTDVSPDLKSKLTVVEIPPQLNIKAEYVVGLVKSEGNVAAKKFYSYLLSTKSQSVLVSSGFVAAK
jgi:molybdate transport system substrate-binding protein